MKKSIFKPTDFSGIKYNVFATDDLTSVHGFDKFTIRERGDKLNMVRYVMALYDKKSPLVRAISNLDQRKNEAALCAGYDLEKDYNEILKAFFEFTDKDLQTLVIDFLIDQGDFYWAMIVSQTRTFYEYQKALLTEVIGDGDKDKLQALQIKSKLMDDSDKIAERLESYYLKVFGDTQISEMARVKNFTPESMAKRDK